MRPRRSPTTALSEEGRAFLQHRVAAFGLMAGGLSLLFLLFRVGMIASVGILDQVSHPAVLLHLGASLLLLGVWVVCRSGSRSRALIDGVEAIGLIGSAFCFGGMGTYIPIQLRGDLIVLLALTVCLVARAIYVPSSPWRTAFLAIAMGAPLLPLAYIGYLRVDPLVRAIAVGPAGIEVTSAAYAVRATLDLSAWWIVVTTLATAATDVIYGLRREVREAQRLGQYVLEEKIGEGGMGVVYRAGHAMLRRPTAIKLLPPERSSEKDVQRFEREVQLTARLTHPNTVTVFDYGRTTDGVFYYAMELLDGASLDQAVRAAGPFPPERALHVLHAVAGALTEAHGIGLIHRDLKPSNIILCERGGVPDVAKVVDFGLVKELGSAGDEALTQANALTGTPLYMSPEAIRAPGSMDARSDLYSLGAVGYFLLTGEPVFSGSGVVEVCAHHLHTAPEPPSRRRPLSGAADLERILLDCLAKSPEERPASAAVLRQRLEGCAGYGSWSSERARAWWDHHAQALASGRAATDGPSGWTAVTTRSRWLEGDGEGAAARRGEAED